MTTKKHPKAKAKEEAVERATALQEPFQSLVIDRFPTCGGVWLDPGELDEFAQDMAGAVRDGSNFFAHERG